MINDSQLEFCPDCLRQLLAVGCARRRTKRGASIKKPCHNPPKSGVKSIEGAARWPSAPRLLPEDLLMKTTLFAVSIIIGSVPLLLCTCSLAEDPYQVSWVRQLGSAGDDFGRGVAADGTGNIYLSGWTSGALAAPNGAGLHVPFLTKFTAQGTQGWVRQEASIPGVGYEGVRVSADNQGNVFAPWYVVSGTGTPSFNNVSSAGTLQWSAPLASGGFGVSSDSLGYAYISNYSGSYFSLTKYSAQNGGVVWSQTASPGPGTNTSGVWADHLGNVFVTGYTSGSNFGPNAGGTDAWVAKYSDQGSLLWSRQYGSSGSDFAFDVSGDAAGNVYTAGYTDGSLGAANAGGTDIFVAKHDPAGNLLWLRQSGSSEQDTLSGVWADKSGNVYLAGRTFGSLGSLGGNLGGSDIAVEKYDPDGNQLWAKQIGTSAEDACSSIFGDDQGNVYLAGRTAGSWEGPNSGAFDAVLIKLSPVPEPPAFGLAALGLIALTVYKIHRKIGSVPPVESEAASPLATADH